MPSSKILAVVRLVIVGSIFVFHARAQDNLKPPAARFTGKSSCATTLCHGGGTGRGECVIFDRYDKHATAHGILGKNASLRIAESLNLKGDPAKHHQCNVCHAPMQGALVELVTKEAAADRGVSCETCHGPAEKYLLFHTRPDATVPQMHAQGMRDMRNIVGRANTCVACHLNLDESIRRAGHPELYFELDAQSVRQPPHYTDERPWLGARQWMTGQAAALREMSAKLADEKTFEKELVPRWKGLLWLLRRTELGKKELSGTEDYGAIKIAADKLAQSASSMDWSKEQVGALLRDYLGLHTEFADSKIDKVEMRRRAEVLIPAIDRLWRAQKKAGGVESAEFEKALLSAFDFVKTFQRARDREFTPAEFVSEFENLRKSFPAGAK
jgi:hypothetical protein